MITKPKGIKAGEGYNNFGRTDLKKLMGTTSRGETIQNQKRVQLFAGKFSGRLTDAKGYCRIKMSCHPRANVRSGYVYEHIVAAEMCLGRFLAPEEVVHHIDGDRTNSYYKNLVVFPGQSSHSKFHWAIRKGKRDSAVLRAKFGAIQCKRPSLSSGGPHWMVSLVNRITGK